MKLDIPWQQLEAYLTIERKQSDGSLPAHKSRYILLSRWFTQADKEFNRDNFNLFIYELKKSGKKPSYLNGFIKTGKHLDRLLNLNQLADYTYFNEDLGQPEDTLTPEEITKLAEVKVKYIRYKDRKEKVKCLIYFLGLVGSRIEETLHLEWRDLSASPLPMVRFRPEITKTKKERYCPLPRWLYAKLQKLPEDRQYIFARLERTSFTADLKLRAKKCKIEKNVHPHLFRASSVNNKLAVGMPLEQVTAYHGHSSTATTYKYYIRIQAQDLARSLYNLDPAFKEDQTFTSMCNSIKDVAEKMYNPRLCSYSYEASGEEVVIRLKAK